MHDLFVDGYVDHAIFQPDLLRDFYINGLRTDRGGVRPGRSAIPDKLTYNHAFDPRDGEAGLAQLRRRRRAV